MASSSGRAAQLQARLLGAQPTDRLWGWVGPLLVTLVAGVMRFWDLGRPGTLVFDETYYVKQAYSMLRWGFERKTNERLSEPDTLFANGTSDVFSTTPDFVVHPPAGKWVIAVGEQLFGPSNPVGWRFSVALLGTLSVLIVARVARRLFGSTLLGMTAGLLLAFEGHHFVHSRTGLLDLILMFFALAAFAALVADRDRTRRILAQRVALVANGSAFGPWLGWRPWRWVAGVCLGLALGTKWSGLYFLAGFGLMTVLWDVGARRAAGVGRWWAGTAVRDLPAAAAVLLGGAAVTYLATWTGWFRSSDAWNRTWGQQNPADGLAALVPDALRGLWHYHREMLDFHVGLTTSHLYMSNPWSWLVQGRPTSFYYQAPTQGQEGCTVAQCSKTITSLGTVSVWWGATLVLLVVVFQWALARDWRAGAVLSGLAAGYLPWFLYQDRTIYSFYTVAFVPWVVLVVTYVLGLLVGPDLPRPRRRRIGLAVTGGFVVLTVVLFLWFWPVYTAQVIPYTQWWEWRMWFQSWI